MRLFLFIILIFSFFFISCENGVKSNENEKYITKYDIEGMREKHLSNYKLYRENIRWEIGREYVFQNLNDSTKFINVRIGFHSSGSEAYEVALKYNRGCSIIPQEDSLEVLGIGNQCWWMPKPFSLDTVTYLFVRINSFIIVNSHSIPNSNLQELARSIDLDIVNNADYIKKKKSISLPKIKKITVSNSELSEGETATIKVTASDPGNENLDYMCSNLNAYNNNMFKIKATRSYVSEPFIGPHTYEFQVINESNVLSEIKEITINIK